MFLSLKGMFVLVHPVHYTTVLKQQSDLDLP